MLERKHIEAIETEVDAARACLDQDWPREAFMRLTDAEVAISAALAACDESPWRSMDSAPKDDTEVLLYFGDGRIEKAVWWDCYGEWVDTREYITMRNPTHWMPLPAAPEIARTGKGENA